MYTKDLRVTNRNDLATGEGDAYRSIGAAYGWNEEPIYDADGKLVNTLTPTDEAIANARLWAAAPELLDAVKSFLKYFGSDDPETNVLAMCEDYSTCTDVQEKCRAALAKADAA